MEERDLYNDLGVSRDASEDEIRRTYRKLARRYHPDVNPNDPKAEERFKQIAFANEVLSDKEKRGRYDEFGMQGLGEGFDPEHAREYMRWSRGARRSPDHDAFSSTMDLDDLLSGLFGRRRGPTPGRDAHAQIAVDFLDAVNGTEVPIQLEGKTLRVRIPPGSDDETRLRLAGKGLPSPDGGGPGDLYLTLELRPDPNFTRSGPDLSLEVPVTLPELMLGAAIQVPTPDGLVTLKVPAHSASGQKLRLAGKGVARREGGRGDLFVTLVAVLPDADQPEYDELAERLRALYGDRDVRAQLRSKT